MTGHEEGTDGRTARRDRNRAAVLDAAVALFAEGHVRPTPEAVAERSGVSLRSVYRYYADRAALREAAMAHHVLRVNPLLVLEEPGEGPLEDRIERFVAGRLRLHDAAAPIIRVVLSVDEDAAPFRARYVERTGELRDQLERQFAPELDALAPPERAATVAALDALSQFGAVEHLRAFMGLTTEETARALRLAFERVLAPAPS